MVDARRFVCSGTAAYRNEKEQEVREVSEFRARSRRRQVARYVRDVSEKGRNEEFLGCFLDSYTSRGQRKGRRVMNHVLKQK